MLNWFRTSILVLVLLLAACAIPVPPEKAAYVGEWKAPGISLLILADGSIVYERIRGGATTKINGPLKAFKGDDFEVGIGSMATTFKVSATPHEKDGKWLMTVDGVELTRTQP